MEIDIETLSTGKKGHGLLKKLEESHGKDAVLKYRREAKTPKEIQAILENTGN